MAERTDRRLSRVQLKEAFELATRMQIDTSGFEVLDADGDDRCVVTEFRHPHTRAFFRFDWYLTYGSGFSLKWWPSADGTSPSQSVDRGGWPEALVVFGRWLKSVKAEVDTPDVWRLAREQRMWLASGENAIAQNTAFNSQEQELIARHLRTIEEFTIKTYQLQADQAAHVREPARISD